MTSNLNATWVFCADAGKGTLWRCKVAPRQRCHVEQIDQIDNNLVGHEHNRPNPLAGKSGSSYAAFGHEKEELHQRFVREAIDWLIKRIEQHGLEKVTLFAPPRFIGAIRKLHLHLPEGRIDLRETDLAPLDRTALARHPAIRELVGLRESQEAPL